jgi:predicted signal transduction protein with EAL and GGDEF domain
VQAVIALAHGLGIEVVAEGIETIEQLDRLRSLVCDRGQGYFYARPQPPEELATMLLANSAGRAIIAAASASEPRSVPAARAKRGKRPVAEIAPITPR